MGARVPLHVSGLTIGVLGYYAKHPGEHERVIADLLQEWLRPGEHAPMDRAAVRYSKDDRRAEPPVSGARADDHRYFMAPATRDALRALPRGVVRIELARHARAADPGIDAVDADARRSSVRVRVPGDVRAHYLVRPGRAREVLEAVLRYVREAEIPSWMPHVAARDPRTVWRAGARAHLVVGEFTAQDVGLLRAHSALAAVALATAATAGIASRKNSQTTIALDPTIFGCADDPLEFMLQRMPLKQRDRVAAMLAGERPAATAAKAGVTRQSVSESLRRPFARTAIEYARRNATPGSNRATP